MKGGEDFSDGIAKVKIPNSKGWCYINKNGVLITDSHFPIATGYKNGLARVINENNEHFYIDKQGNYFHSYYSEDISENVSNMKVDDNGTVYTGGTKNGIPNGIGKYSKPDGSWYEGNISNWLENGLGTKRSTDGKRYYGNWVNGVPDGIFQVKEWTLGGVVSNEWYVKYDMGSLISAEQTKNDFDKFLSKINESATLQSQSEKSNKKIDYEDLKIPTYKRQGIYLNKDEDELIRFDDGVSGKIFYSDSKGKYYVIGSNYQNTFYQTKADAIYALYVYKKYGVIVKRNEVK